MLTIKFLTTLIPEEMYEEVRKKSIYNMQDAASALQWHLYEGLCENYHQNIEILNILPVGSFPQYYKDAFIRKKKINTGVNIGFCNITKSSFEMVTRPNKYESIGIKIYATGY